MADSENPGSRDVWTLRIIHTFALLALLGMVGCCVAITGKYMVIYQQLELKELPLLTELMLKLSDLLRQHEGILIVGFVGLTLVVFGLTGVLDSVLLPLIVLYSSLIVFLLIGWLIGLKLPLWKIQSLLSR